uniref:Metallo-beta-lactamase domain-containing protein n=1 Tax=Alexandrium monilatum TaxID=311494 RepID=A0A7S4Q469_9DINO|mmetsp:Transcript_81958/g.244436  ORF Transcript_81958/g.244436 Transcript_81958/m.244436 type:complete len:338 (+) Transcript_81958:58-1071(+)
MVHVEGGPPGVEVHQLLCGRDIAVGGDAIAHMASQMANYVYVVVDAHDKGKRSAVVIDACWDVEGLLRYCQEELRVEKPAAALYTHRHFDHTGGRLPRSMTGGRQVRVPGLHEFAERGITVGVGRDDVEAVAKQTGVDAAAIRSLGDGETLGLGGEGSAVFSVLSTPGHTSGSICLQLKADAESPAAEATSSMLFTGDTLFIGSCGRYDLPESDFRSMLASLDRLSKLPRETVVLPGHNYAAPAHTTIGAEHDTNDIMIQAMGLVKSGRIAPSPVAAFLPLPDYLGVAQRVAASFQATGPVAGVCEGCWDEDEDECVHGHWPLPFFAHEDCAPRGRL